MEEADENGKYILSGQIRKYKCSYKVSAEIVKWCGSFLVLLDNLLLWMKGKTVLDFIV